jgi:hypothetical protein
MTHAILPGLTVLATGRTRQSRQNLHRIQNQQWEQ